MSLHGYTPAEAFEVRAKHAAEAVYAFDPDAAAYRQRTEAWVRVALSAQDARERELNPQYVDSDMEIAALTARCEELESRLALNDSKTQLAARVEALTAALREKPDQPILNAARRLVVATDNAERNAALGDLHNALATSEQARETFGESRHPS
jgi:hypothetical protein